MHKFLLFLIFACLIAGCMNYSPSQLNATAVVLGCYPYGYLPEPATSTIRPNRLTPTANPAISTSTPQPTWAMCTPAPRTPTLTPTLRPTATMWTRPTELPPVQRDTPPLNLSNQGGYDKYPAIAIHPTEGWAAVAWTNWHWDYPNEGNVLVKVQANESAWNAARGVNPEGVSKDAGEVSMTIGNDGRIHVTYQGLDQVGRYSYSDDRGKTWSNPETIPMPSGYQQYTLSQLWLDDQNTLHSLYRASPAYLFSNYIHASRTRNGTWSMQNQIIRGDDQLYGDGLSLRTNGKLRQIVAVGCRTGCDHSAGIEIATSDDNGAWITRQPPANQDKRVDQVVQWVNLISFVSTGNQKQYICVTWGQYSKSSLQFSCSTDAGNTWSESEIIAHHNETMTLPDPETGGTFEILKYRGYHPEAIYIAQFDTVMVVWNYLNAETNTSSLVYSYRKLGATTWTPFIDAQIQPVDVPLRLFDATRRSAGFFPRVAPTANGLVKVVWVEHERDESNEIYYGTFFAPALVAKEK